ncbi:Integrase core domain protein [Streptomyces sp. YIM 121038]|nr:Integrase core domain protein [Streptomyces sp. YIM 121038]
MAPSAFLGTFGRPGLRPKRTRIISLYTAPPPDTTVICADELGSVIPRTFPPGPGWSPGGHRIKSELDYGRGPEKTWVFGGLRVRDGIEVAMTAPSRSSFYYQQFLERVEQANPTGAIWIAMSRHSPSPGGGARRGPHAGSVCVPVVPGVPERRSYDYVRAGTTTLFAALEVATGKVIGSLHRRHRAAEFKKFLTKLDKEVPQGLDVHLILDNYATHKTPDIKKWLLAHPRFHLHFTPTSASWLNLVERWFAELTQKKLKRGVHHSVQALERDIRAWLADWNEHPRPFVWTKTADEILDKVATYCRRISDSGH